jgi:PAS domain S-box-containing protein
VDVATAGLSPSDINVGRLVRHLRDAVIVGDTRTGRIVLWNPAAAALFGYTTEEAIGLPIDVLVPEPLRARHQAGLGRYRRTGHGPLTDSGGPVELPARRKSGEEFWIELSLSPLEVDAAGGPFVLALIRDATPRKLAEVERRDRLRAEAGQAEAEQRARLAAFGADVGRALTHSRSMSDALGGTAEAIVRHLDAAFARIWTLNETDQMLELRASAGLYTHLDGQHSRVPVGQLKIGLMAATGQPYLTNDAFGDPRITEKDWLRREGLVAFAGYPLLVDDRVVGVLGLFARHPFGPEMLAELSGVLDGIGQYIERKRTEEALQSSEERFRALIERSSDMITLHRPDGTILYASPSMVRLLGYESHELLDRNLLEYVHPDDRSEVVNGFTELLAQPRRSTTGRYRIRHRDGSWRWIETTRTNLLHEPAVSAVVCNKRDVTAEVQAQQHLEQTVAERTQELSTLLEVSRGLGSTLELRRLIELIFDQLKISVDYSAVGLHIANEQGEYQTLDYRGPLPRERILLNWNSPTIVALLRQAGATGRPVIVDDFGGDTPMMRHFEAEGIQLPKEAYGHARAVLIAPLLAKGRHIGGLTLMHRVRGHYTSHHAEYVMAFAQHASVAIENARLYEALHDKAALEERQRLARELHDSVSQALYAIALNGAAAADSLHKQDHPRAARQVRHVRQLARAGLAEMRALIFELRVESLAEEGLVAALSKQAAAVEARHQLKIRSRFTPEPPLSMIAKEALYRIAQEALHNVVKHARARRVDLTLEVVDDNIVLTVRDNGHGFELGTAFPGHLGLRSMQERAEAVGGSLSLDSAPRAGTVVRVQVPVASA